MTRILEQFPMTVTRYYLSVITGNNPKQGSCVQDVYTPPFWKPTCRGFLIPAGRADNTVLPGLQQVQQDLALIRQSHPPVRHVLRALLPQAAGGESPAASSRKCGPDGCLHRLHPEITNISSISGGDSLLNNNQIIRRYLGIQLH